MRLIDADKIEENCVELDSVLGEGNVLTFAVRTLINKFSTETQWISSAKELPDTTEYVLTLTDKGKICILSHNHNGEWENNVNGRVYSGEITHWMPLPAPPESEVNNES